MKIGRLLLMSLGCALFGSTILRAESGHELENVINNFNSRYPQEKVFLHFDNTAYYNDETIWWKAYVLHIDSIPMSLRAHWLGVVDVDAKRR